MTSANVRRVLGHTAHSLTHTHMHTHTHAHVHTHTHTHTHMHTHTYTHAHAHVHTHTHTHAHTHRHAHMHTHTRTQQCHEDKSSLGEAVGAVGSEEQTTHGQARYPIGPILSGIPYLAKVTFLPLGSFRSHWSRLALMQDNQHTV